MTLDAFGFLQSPGGRTRSNCPYCHGVKCMGACGNNPDEYKDVSVCGIVRRPTRHLGLIECEEGPVYDFAADSELGREILSACPPGSRCQLEGKQHEGTLKFVVYMELLHEHPEGA